MCVCVCVCMCVCVCLLQRTFSHLSSFKSPLKMALWHSGRHKQASAYLSAVLPVLSSNKTNAEVFAHGSFLTLGGGGGGGG